ELVPHGWTDEQLRRYLQQMLNTKFITDPDQSLLDTPLASAVRQSLDTWRLPNHPPKPEERPQTVRQYLDDELAVAIKTLRLQCNECHQMAPQPNSLEVARPANRSAWFMHAKFSHVLHRGVSCQECHSGAYPGKPPEEPTSIDTLDGDNVLIPGRQLC